MKDQKALPIRGEDFDGLYDRGVSGTTYNPTDPCPANGFTKATQVRFTPWGLQGRPGTNTFTPFTTPAGIIVQILPYHTNNSLTGAIVNGYFLVEHAGGNTNVYDSNAAVPATPIATVGAQLLRVSFIVLYGRIAFSFHDFTVGGQALFFNVYKPGAALARINGGVGPTLAGVNFASSGTAGFVTQGTHVFGLAYEYDTGHISFLNTTSGTDVGFFTLAAANQQVTATGLPAVFPANVRALHILASRLVVNSSGNAPDYEVFFVQRLTVAAAASTFNFTDESLSDSADYLFDLVNPVPSPLGFTFYAGRLITWGEYYSGPATVGPSCLRVSEQDDPESFSSTHGVVEVFRDDGDSGVKSCWEYKGLLIIQKETRTFVTRDNGDEPNTWQVDVLDGTIGGVLYGIAKTSNQVGAIRTDYVITVARNGVYLFDGKFNEIPLTWKIERLWQSISEQSEYFQYQLIDIPTAKLLIFKVWSDPSETGGHNPYMLVCDYSKGLGYQTVRWSRWFFNGQTPVWLAMEDRNNMRIVENVSNVLDNMIIGTEDSEINAFFEDGEITTGDLNPDEELNYWHWAVIKARGDFSTVVSCNFIIGGITNPLLLPQAPLEVDVTKIILNQSAYFPQFNLTWAESSSTKLRIRQLCYFRQLNASDLLGA